MREFLPETEPVGEIFLWHVPPPNRPSPKGSASSTPPQGGSDLVRLGRAFSTPLLGEVRLPRGASLRSGRVFFRESIAFRRLFIAFRRIFLLIFRIFSSHGESAFPRNCCSCVRRAFGRVAERIAPCAEARRARHFHEDETMTKQISCEPFTPAHPGRRENFARLPGIGGSDRAMESRPGERACVNREFPKNSINIDKFTGFFDKFPKINLRKNSSKVLKNICLNINMSVGHSNTGPENFFARRICPQIR